MADNMYSVHIGEGRSIDATSVRVRLVVFAVFLIAPSFLVSCGEGDSVAIADKIAAINWDQAPADDGDGEIDALLEDDIPTIEESFFEANGLQRDQEVTGMRTADSYTFRKTSGEYVTVIASGRVNYVDSAGKLRPIDARVTPESGPVPSSSGLVVESPRIVESKNRDGFEVAFANETNSLASYFAETSEGGMIATFDADGDGTRDSGMRWRHVGRMISLPGEANEQRVARVRGESDGTSVRYPGVYSEVDEEFHVHPGRVEHRFVLSKRPLGDSQVFDENSLIAFAGRLMLTPGLLPYVDGELMEGNFETSSAIVFKDRLGEAKFQIGKPIVFEKNDPFTGTLGKFIFRREATGEITFSLAASISWLMAEEREYPVVIDPSPETINSNSAWTIYSDVDDASSGTESWGSTGSGYVGTYYTGISDNFHNYSARFDCSTVPPGAFVIGAEFGYYHNWYTGTPPEITMVKGASDPGTQSGSSPPSGDASTLWADIYSSSTSYSSTWDMFASFGGYNDIDLNSTALTDIEAAADTDSYVFMGMRVNSGEFTPGNSNYASISQSNDGSPPRLVVTYTYERTLDAITVTQSSVEPVEKGSNDFPMLRLQFDVTDAGGTLSLDSITVTSNNTNDADVASSGVKAYATIDETFDTGTPIGTPGTFSAGEATVGSLAYGLPEGTSYVWITFDIDSGATLDNVVDCYIGAGDITITASGGANDPSAVIASSLPQDPAGSRSIYQSIKTFNAEGWNVWTVSGTDSSGASDPVRIRLDSVSNPSASTVYNWCFGFTEAERMEKVRILRDSSGTWEELARDVIRFSTSKVYINFVLPAGHVTGDIYYLAAGGTLSTSAPTYNSLTLAFEEDFETDLGSFSQDPSGGPTLAVASDITMPDGSQAMKLSDADNADYVGAIRSVGHGTNELISFYAYTNGSGLTIYHGEGTEANPISWKVGYDTTGMWELSESVNPVTNQYFYYNLFQKITIDVDYTAGTYDFYVDDNLRVSNVPFVDTGANPTEIHVHTAYAGDNSFLITPYIDLIQVYTYNDSATHSLSAVSTNPGMWNDGWNWDPLGVPTSSNDVVIPNETGGFSMWAGIDNGGSAGSVYIASGRYLNWNGGTLDFGRDLTIVGEFSGGGDQLTIGDDLNLYGTANFWGPVVFTASGADDATINGVSSINFNEVVVAAGSVPANKVDWSGIDVYVSSNFLFDGGELDLGTKTLQIEGSMGVDTDGGTAPEFTNTDYTIALVGTGFQNIDFAGIEMNRLLCSKPVARSFGTEILGGFSVGELVLDSSNLTTMWLQDGDYNLTGTDDVNSFIIDGGVLSIGDGIIPANGATFTTAARVNVGSGGTLMIDSNGTLLLPAAGINSDGAVKSLAQLGPAVMTTSGTPGTDRFSIDVNSGGEVDILGLQVESPDAGGFHIASGATITRFDDVSFSEGVSGSGTYLDIDVTTGAYTLRLNDFDQNCLKNVSVPAGSSISLTMENCGGAKGDRDATDGWTGESEDDDPDGDVHVTWVYFKQWIGSSSDVWSYGPNWEGGEAPSNVPGEEEDILLRAGDPYSPVLDENARVRNITIDTNGELHLGDKTLTITGSNFQTFGGDLVPDTGTVVFGGTSDQAVNVGVNPLYNFVIDKAGGSVLLAGDMMVQNDFTLVDGTFDLNGHKMFVGIPWDNPAGVYNFILDSDSDGDGTLLMGEGAAMLVAGPAQTNKATVVVSSAAIWAFENGMGGGGTDNTLTIGPATGSGGSVTITDNAMVMFGDGSGNDAATVTAGGTLRLLSSNLGAPTMGFNAFDVEVPVTIDGTFVASSEGFDYRPTLGGGGGGGGGETINLVFNGVVDIDGLQAGSYGIDGMRISDSATIVSLRDITFGGNNANNSTNLTIERSGSGSFVAEELEFTDGWNVDKFVSFEDTDGGSDWTLYISNGYGYVTGEFGGTNYEAITDANIGTKQDEVNTADIVWVRELQWYGQWQYKRQITVTNTSGSSSLPAGAPVEITFDHASLVSAGKSLASGADVRVLYVSGNTAVELNRVVWFKENTTGWNSSETTIIFPTFSQIAASDTDDGYYIYYGNPGASEPSAYANDIGVYFLGGFESGSFTTGDTIYYYPSGSQNLSWWDFADFDEGDPHLDAAVSGSYGAKMIGAGGSSYNDFNLSSNWWSDIPGTESNVYLFYSRQVIENNPGTNNVVFTTEVSTDGGANWSSTLETVSASDAMTLKGFSISNGSVRFRFRATFSNTLAADGDGFYIDDVRVYANSNGSLPSTTSFAAAGEVDMSGLWNDPMNWSPSGIPDSNTAVTIGGNYSFEPNVSAASTVLTVDVEETLVGQDMILNDTLTVLRDFNLGTVDEGEGYLDLNGNTLEVGGIFEVEQGGFAGTGTIILNKDLAGETQVVRSILGAITIPGNLTISGDDTYVLLEQDLAVTGTLTVSGGTNTELEILDGKTLTLSGASSSIAGKLDVEPGSTLDLGSSHAMSVSGSLELVGTSDTNRAIVTNGSNTNGYSLSVTGALNAKYYEIAYPGANGLQVGAGASISAPNNLSNGYFHDPVSTTGVLLDFTGANFGGAFTSNDVRFSAGGSSGAKGVRGGASHGVVTFEDSVGTLSGAANEDDSSAKIDWDPDPTDLPSILSAVAEDASAGGKGIQVGDTVTIVFSAATNAPALTSALLNTHLTVAGKTWGTNIQGYTWSTVTYSNDKVVVRMGVGSDVAPGNSIDLGDGTPNTLVKNAAETLNATGSVAITGTFGANLTSMISAIAAEAGAGPEAGPGDGDTVILRFDHSTNAFSIGSNIDSVLQLPAGKTWGTITSAVWGTVSEANDKLTVTIGSGATLSVGNAISILAGTIKDDQEVYDVIGSPPVISGSFIDTPPNLASAIASDGSSNPYEAGIEYGDYVLLTFDGSTNGYAVNSGNVDTVLPLPGGHTWLNEFGMIDKAVWSAGNSKLTIWLHTPPIYGSANPATVAIGDLISIAADTIEASGGGPDATNSGSLTISGTFGGTLSTNVVSAVADDNGASGGPNAGDRVTFIFDEATNLFTTGGPDVVLPVATKTWGTGATMNWPTSTTLIVTLGTSPTVEEGDLITLAADTIESQTGGSDAGGFSIVITGDFGATPGMWTGIAGTSWTNTTNWDDYTVPTAGQSVTIPAGKPSYPNIASTLAAAPGDLTIASGASFTVGTGVTFTATGNVSSGGTFTVSGTGEVTVNGNLSITGGTFTAPSGKMTVLGAFSHTGGTFDANSGTVWLKPTSNQNLTVSSSTDFANLTLNDGLLGYWKLDETSTPTLDSSGYGNSGTWAGDPNAVTGSTNIGYRNPQSLEFDAGEADRVNVGSPETLDDIEAMSISAWIYADTRGGTGTEAAKGMILTKADSIGNNGWLFGFRGSTYNWALRFRVTYSTQNLLVIFNDTPGLAGGWHHVCVTWDGGTTASSSIKLYIDGTVVDHQVDTNGTGSRVTDASQNLSIGNSASGTNNWDGKLDDVRLYDRVFTAGEIAKLSAGDMPETTLAVTTVAGDALDVNGDLIIASGTLDASGSNYGVSVAGSWLNNGGVFVERSGTVTLDAASGSKMIIETGDFYNLTQNAGTATYNCWSDFSVAGLFDLQSGTFEIDGRSVTLTGAATVHGSGIPTLSLNGTGSLLLGTSLTVGDGTVGGKLRVQNTSAIVDSTAQDSTYYSLTVKDGSTSDGRLDVTGGMIYSLDSDGIKIESGVDPSGIVIVGGSSGDIVFDFIEAGGTYIQFLETGSSDFTVSNCSFDDSSANALYNISTAGSYSGDVDASAGNVGAVSGSAFENDRGAGQWDGALGSTIDWGTEASVPVYWTGATNTDWNTAGNWEGGALPGIGVAVAIPDVSGLSGNFPTIGAAPTNTPGSIEIHAGATLTIASGIDVTVRGDVTIAGTLTMSGSETLAVYGDWTNTGTFSAATSTVEFRGSQDGSVSVGIGASTDDGEENASTGAMNMTSSDLEMVTDGATVQNVGMRFLGITIPSDVTIDSAYITFTADSSDSGATNLSFFAEDIDDSTTFTSAAYDISGRAKTAAQVDWNGISAWTAGNTYQTPDLSSLIREVIDRPGWTSGNSISFIATGSGKRNAKSWNDASGVGAPSLSISYSGYPSSIISGSTTFHSLECTYPGKVLTFAAGSTQTVNGELVLRGAGGNEIVLQSSSPGTAWTISDGGVESVSYVDVTDSTASNGIMALSSVNGGGNTNWTFITPATWTGATDSDWDTSSNWSPAAIPGSTSVVLIPDVSGASGIFPVLSSSATIASLFIDPGANLDLSGASTDLTITSGYFCEGLFDGRGSAVTFDGTLTLAGGGTHYFGNVDIPVTGSLSAGAETVFVSGDWTNSGTFSAGTGTIEFIGASGGAGSASNSVAQSSDDAEQRLDTNAMNLNVGRCYLGTNGTTPRAVGIRFQNVQIPRNSVISNAYIEFRATDTDSGATDLTFVCEDVDDSSVFTSAAYDITARANTSASVDWNTVPAWTSGSFYQTTDISDIVQEVIDRASWTSGNALTIIVTGTGMRRGRSFDYNGSDVPRLVIDYDTQDESVIAGNTTFGNLSCASPGKQLTFTAGSNQTVTGLLALTGNTAEQVVLRSSSDSSAYTITDSGTESVSYVDVKDSTAANSIDATVGGLDSGGNTNWIFGTPGLWTGATNSDWNDESNWDNYYVPSAGASATIPAGASNYPVLTASPDFTPGNVTIDAGGGLVTVNSGVTFAVDGNIAIDGTLTMNGTSTLTVGGNFAKTGTFNAGSGTVTFGIPTGAGTTVTSQVAASADDAEQNVSTGAMSLTSDLELGYDGANAQYVGMRFPAFAVPNDAIILDAYITFYADETGSSATNLTFVGEAADNSSVFTTTASNISSRVQTTASVAWSSVPSWTAVDGTHNSPDMTDVVQEVISRPGWASGNALTIIASGTGTRTARSYNDSATKAPKLTVTYVTSSASIVSGNTTFNNLSCVTPGKQLTFTAGTTQTIGGALTLTGSVSKDVTLRSSSDGSVWNINDAGTEDVTYVDVKDSTATNSIFADTSEDSGNNTNWLFDLSKTWDGSAGSDWNDGANWQDGLVPGAGDPVIIPSGSPNYPVLTAPPTNAPGDVTIDSGATLTIDDNAALTMSGSMTVNGSLSVTGSAGNHGLLLKSSGGVLSMVIGASGSVNFSYAKNATGAGDATSYAISVGGANATIDFANCVFDYFQSGMTAYVDFQSGYDGLMVNVDSCVFANSSNTVAARNIKVASASSPIVGCRGGSGRIHGERFDIDPFYRVRWYAGSPEFTNVTTGNTYPSLSSAIAAASAGDTIRGTSGVPYFGDVTITKNLIIEEMLIVGDIVCSVSGVTIRNCFVKGNVGGVGSEFRYVYHCSVDGDIHATGAAGDGEANWNLLTGTIALVSGATKSQNVESITAATYWANPALYDFHLKSNATTIANAIDKATGSTTVRDFDSQTRTSIDSLRDIGADERPSSNIGLVTWESSVLGPVNHSYISMWGDKLYWVATGASEGASDWSNSIVALDAETGAVVAGIRGSGTNSGFPDSLLAFDGEVTSINVLVVASGKYDIYLTYDSDGDGRSDSLTKLRVPFSGSLSATNRPTWSSVSADEWTFEASEGPLSMPTFNYSGTAGVYDVFIIADSNTAGPDTPFANGNPALYHIDNDPLGSYGDVIDSKQRVADPHFDYSRGVAVFITNEITCSLKPNNASDVDVVRLDAADLSSLAEFNLGVNGVGSSPAPAELGTNKMWFLGSGDTFYQANMSGPANVSPFAPYDLGVDPDGAGDMLQIAASDDTAVIANTPRSMFNTPWIFGGYSEGGRSYIFKLDLTDGTTDEDWIAAANARDEQMMIGSVVPGSVWYDRLSSTVWSITDAGYLYAFHCPNVAAGLGDDGTLKQGYPVRIADANVRYVKYGFSFAAPVVYVSLESGRTMALRIK
ncbi:MAG: hypothetical protein NUW37_05345 [Planctomycetes bacterium]|nr:hypothetical protein [Planctomycetota bacterium]